MTSPRISFIVPTKDRPRELRRMLRSLGGQTRLPDQVVVVDGSSTALTEAFFRESGLPVEHLCVLPPSASRQRNRGLAAVPSEFGLVGFVDDDVVFEPGSVEAMMDFWAQAGADVGGAAFNMVNHPSLDFGRWKRTRLVERLGLYSRKRGAVAASGFQSLVGCVAETVFVDWLSTGAVVWRRRVFDRHRFDEWFGGYSYLEDLDFSYRVGKEYRLAVVAPARYRHLQASEGRGRDYAFGRREAFNRMHFVAKHPELSRSACLLALAVRFGLSLSGVIRNGRPAFALRALGNLIGVVEGLVGGGRA